MTTQDFINEIKDGAIQAMKEQRVLASLTMAQAILESAWGKSCPVDTTSGKESYNLFGIKGAGTAGTVTCQTQEWNGVAMVTVTADFRAYNSFAESIEDHTKLLATNSRYSNLIGETDYKRAATLIYKDGYATDPDYAAKLINIIEYNNLAQYDQQVLDEVTHETETSSWAQEARTYLMQIGATDGSRPKDVATREQVWTMICHALQHKEA